MTSVRDARRDVTALFLHAHACPAGCTADDAGVTDIDYQAADQLIEALDRISRTEHAEEATR